MKTQRILGWIASVCFAIIAFEHYGRVHKWQVYTPTWALFRVASHIRHYAECVGTWLAYLSSFYEYLYLYELGQTLLELARALWSCISAPLWILKGYAETAITYPHPYIIILGSCTLITLAIVFIPFRPFPTLRQEIKDLFSLPQQPTPAVQKSPSSLVRKRTNEDVYVESLAEPVTRSGRRKKNSEAAETHSFFY
jgi:hypothetical protein